jgi:hypothetical protein
MTTAPKITDGEALEILRRLEPALESINGRLDKIEVEQRRQGEAIAELRGRVISLPTIWQIVPVMTTINGAVIALGFTLAKLVK